VFHTYWVAPWLHKCVVCHTKKALSTPSHTPQRMTTTTAHPARTATLAGSNVAGMAPLVLQRTSSGMGPPPARLAGDLHARRSSMAVGVATPLHSTKRSQMFRKNFNHFRKMSCFVSEKSFPKTLASAAGLPGPDENGADDEGGAGHRYGPRQGHRRGGGDPAAA